MYRKVIHTSHPVTGIGFVYYSSLRQNASTPPVDRKDTRLNETSAGSAVPVAVYCYIRTKSEKVFHCFLHGKISPSKKNKIASFLLLLLLVVVPSPPLSRHAAVRPKHWH